MKRKALLYDFQNGVGVKRLEVNDALIPAPLTLNHFMPTSYLGRKLFLCYSQAVFPSNQLTISSSLHTFLITGKERETQKTLECYFSFATPKKQKQDDTLK